ncbi:type VI secretion system baseplate subunit TssG [Variovorax sp. GB1P17]|uniref:type VI secretion system baseplate subunit TssG n=1 Tax=Variovorax sp. GB1P17 TaxID=3443740 RepID=UPI003F47DDFD
MGTDDRPPGGAVIDSLTARPQDFNLFQAISLLERAAPDAVAVGRAQGPREREAVRLRAFVSLAFEASDVRAIDGAAQTGEPFTLTTCVLSLAGAGGPLPLHVAELLLERRQRRDHASADFLDIFNHRFLAFFYRSRRKHHVALHPRAPAQSTLAATLDAASALGIRSGVRAPDNTALWLRHAGLLGGAPRSMTGLLAMLRDRLGVQVQGTQFRGGWHALEPDAFLRLDAGTRLGPATVLGQRVWDQGAGIRLAFSGLSRQRLLGLLPGGGDHALAQWLVRRFVPRDLDVEMELKLAPAAARSSVLGAANPMRLGWTSWVAGPAFRGPLPPVRHRWTRNAIDTGADRA